MSKVTNNDLISTGFDRGIDFKSMKKLFIAEYEKIINSINELSEDDRNYVSKRRKLINRLIYLFIAMIQLRNGSRISEAVEAFILFMDSENFEDKVIVKIAKSKSIKYKKDTKEQYETKTRYRKMIFPNKWFDIDFISDMKFYLEHIDKERLKKRVLDFLLLNFNCNTHSLRYSFINYMLYDQKKEMTLIAKFVGHVDVSQLVRYTQQKNTEQIFDLDI